MTNALAAMEKLKETFNKERADWETEKASLTKKAEDAEAALKPVVEELTGLKWQINAMTSAVFGDTSYEVFPIHNILSIAGLLMFYHDRDPHYSSGLQHADEA